MKKRSYHLYQVCLIFIVALILVAFFGSEDLSGWANDRLNPVSRKIFSPLTALHQFNSESGFDRPASSLNKTFKELRDYKFPVTEIAPTNPEPETTPSTPQTSPVKTDIDIRKKTVVKGKISILLMGDSLARATNFRFTPVANQYDDLIFRVEDVVSANLLHLQHYNWPARSAEIAKEEDWDVVLIMLGTNSCQSVYVGDQLYAFNTPGWIETYKSRAKEVINNFKNDGSEVWWIGLPPMSDKNFNANISIVNGIIMDICKETDIKFVPIDKIFGDENGNYVNYKVIDGKQVALRLDGIHYSYPGAQLLSDFLIDKIRMEYKFKSGKLIEADKKHNEEELIRFHTIYNREE